MIKRVMHTPHVSPATSIVVKRKFDISTTTRGAYEILISEDPFS
jgi:hypothetical protein